jgi:DNA (cytosine-5)-methyltransferase 1
MRRRKRAQSKIDAVDLFCGAGGLSYGLLREGINVRAGFDLDPACEWPFKKNIKAPFHCEDVGKLTGKRLRRHYRRSSIRLLAGCAPCQRFSTYTQKESLSNRQRWRLLESFGRVATELKPEIITMENVPGLARHRRFKQFIRTLRRAGYSVWSDIVECADYGMPQRRQRVVVLASKLGPLELITPERFGAKSETVKNAIANLPKVRAGQTHRLDSLHRASKLSEMNRKRISASRQSGTWRDWSDDLVLPCHRKTTGDGYQSVYGRMSWDDQSPTITTLAYNYGSGRFGHPTQDRAITLREAALLQTFPRRYSFVKPNEQLNVRIVGRLIGNAVPVALARVIGRSIVTHLNSLNAKRKARLASQPARRRPSKRR